MNQLLLIFLTAFVFSITAEKFFDYGFKYDYEFVLKVLNVSNAKQQVKGNIDMIEIDGKDGIELVYDGAGVDFPHYVHFKPGKEVKGSVSLALNSIENVYSVRFWWNQVTEIKMKIIFTPKNHTTGSSKSFCHEGGVEPYPSATFLPC